MPDSHSKAVQEVAEKKNELSDIAKEFGLTRNADTFFMMSRVYALGVRDGAKTKTDECVSLTRELQAIREAAWEYFSAIDGGEWGVESELEVKLRAALEGK